MVLLLLLKMLLLKMLLLFSLSINYAVLEWAAC